MKKALAALLLACTTAATFPAMPVRAAGDDIVLLNGWEVGSYRGTNFHLVTERIDGYKFSTDSGGNIILKSTSSGVQSEPAILYAFPVKNVPTDGTLVSWTDEQGTKFSFPYYTDFEFLQFLLGTQKDANGNWTNPLIDTSSVEKGSQSDTVQSGGSGPVKSGVMDTQLWAYPSYIKGQLYNFEYEGRNMVEWAREDGIPIDSERYQGVKDYFDIASHAKNGDIIGTAMSGTLLVNVRLLPPVNGAGKWGVTRWSYTYDPEAKDKMRLLMECFGGGAPTQPGCPDPKPVVKQAPVPVDDEITWNVNKTRDYLVSAAYLLQNDTDVDSPHDKLQILKIDGITAQGNTISWDDTAGIIQFKTRANWSGNTDTFTYRVKDEEGLSTATQATVTIKLVDPDMPVARPDIAQVGKGVSTAIQIPVLANDEPPAQPATSKRTIAISRINPPLTGSAQIVGDQVTYTPAPGFAGDDVIFSYTVTAYVDGVKTDKEATTSITVNYECSLNPGAPQCASKPPSPPVRGPIAPPPSCKPGAVVGNYAEDLTRTIPTGDGRYQFITRSDRGSTGNYKVFVASETLESDRQAFRDYNDILSDYLAKSSASSKDYQQPTIKTDFLATLTAAGMGTVGDKEIALLMQQVEDINRIMKSASPSEMHQLKTIEGRTQFWTSKGIYDKYTPKEIAFMNSVAFPVAMVTEVNGLLVGAALGDGSAQLSIPSSAKTLSVVTVLQNQEALADVWRKVASGQQIDVQELATRLTSKEAIQKAVNNMGLGSELSETLHKAVKAASGTSDTTAALQLLADKLDRTPEVNKGQVKSYLATMSKAWGVPEVVGEVNAEQYKQVMQIINQMSCVSGAPTSVWNIDHKLSN